MKKLFFTAIALVAMGVACATAQVIIGSTDNPQPFSILEIVSNGNSGLRLPQLTSEERDDLAATLAGNSSSQGLEIFNTTTKCVETWNGTKWIATCMDCSDVTVSPVIASVYSKTVKGSAVEFSVLNPLTGYYYLWQVSGDGGQTWINQPGSGMVNSITFQDEGMYLIRAQVSGCAGIFSNILTMEVLPNVTPLTEDAIKIVSMNNVMYSYQYLKLEAYVTAGNPLGYQWYVKYTGDYKGAALNMPPALDEVSDIIPGENSPYYVFEPDDVTGHDKRGTYYFYCKTFGNSGSISRDSFLVRVEDLWTGGLGYNDELIDKAKWLEDSVYIEDNNVADYMKKDGPIYWIQIVPDFRMAHANLGSTKTRDAGELGNLFQWGRNEDGHEYRQYEGMYDNWENLNHKTTADGSVNFTSGQRTGQVAGNPVVHSDFIIGNSNWISGDTNYSTWTNVPGAKDPCTARNTSDGWRLPTSNGDVSDWRKLTGGNTSLSWTGNAISDPGGNQVFYRYPWSGRGPSWYHNPFGSVTFVSKEDNRFVVILPASGSRSGNGTNEGNLYTVGYQGRYHGSTEAYASYSCIQGLFFDSASLNTSTWTMPKSEGYSVRCIQEDSPQQ